MFTAQQRGNEMNLQAPLTFKIHRKPAVPVLSVADAAAKWAQYRDESGEGCSTLGNGGVVRQGKKAIAWISYNGKIWDSTGAISGNENGCFQLVDLNQQYDNHQNR